MCCPGSFVCGTGSVPSQHGRRLPAVEAHEVGFAAIIVEPVVRACVAENVWVQALSETGLFTTATNQLRYA
jgi:hypothetical protein